MGGRCPPESDRPGPCPWQGQHTAQSGRIDGVRISTNAPAIVAQTHLHRAARDLAITLERLSSGLRINRGTDGPAGLIASEVLRAELEANQLQIDSILESIDHIANTT